MQRRRPAGFDSRTVRRRARVQIVRRLRLRAVIMRPVARRFAHEALPRWPRLIVIGGRLGRAFGGGIGLSNVNERLRTIYGAGCQLRLSSVPGEGTVASLEIPQLVVAERVTA